MHQSRRLVDMLRSARTRSLYTDGHAPGASQGVMAHAQTHVTDDITGSDGTCAEARD